jgi:hypothetical protein
MDGIIIVHEVIHSLKLTKNLDIIVHEVIHSLKPLIILIGIFVSKCYLPLDSIKPRYSSLDNMSPHISSLS